MSRNSTQANTTAPPGNLNHDDAWGPFDQARKPFEECVICLQPISERAVAVPCNHLSFDFICLASWVQEHASCPLCKAQLTAIQYDFRGQDDYKTYHIPVVDTKPLRPTSATPTTSNARFRPYRNRFRNRPYLNNRSGSAPPSTTTPDAALQRRRYIYRHQLYSLHVGSNRLSRFKEFTPQDFSGSAELQVRARKWIRRELQVFDFLSPDSIGATTVQSAAGRRRTENAEFLLMYIVAILKTVDIKGSSGKAEEMLQAYLGEENTRLFLHELTAWLRSPYISLESWDSHVQYQHAIPTYSDSSKSDASGLPLGGESVTSASQPTPNAENAHEREVFSNVQFARRRHEPD